PEPARRPLRRGAVRGRRGARVGRDGPGGRAEGVGVTAPDVVARRLTGGRRLALLMEGHLRTRNGKMGFGLLRYSSSPVACVVAPSDAGGDLRAITGVDVDVPIV